MLVVVLGLQLLQLRFQSLGIFAQLGVVLQLLLPKITAGGIKKTLGQERMYPEPL